MREDHSMCLKLKHDWLFEKFVDSGNPKCNSVDTHTAEEGELA